MCFGLALVKSFRVANLHLENSKESASQQRWERVLLPHFWGSVAETGRHSQQEKERKHENQDVYSYMLSQYIFANACTHVHAKCCGKIENIIDEISQWLSRGSAKRPHGTVREVELEKHTQEWVQECSNIHRPTCPLPLLHTWRKMSSAGIWIRKQ